MQWSHVTPNSFPVNARKVYAALSPRGVFYLNQGALLKLGDPPAVRLMYNADRKVIGIAPVPIHTTESFLLRRKDGDRVASRTFAAAPFCREIGILPDRTIQFPEPKIEDGILILDTTTTIYAPRRGILKSRS